MTTSKRLAAFRAAEPADDLENDPAKTDPTRPEDDEDELQPESKKKDKDMTTITQEAHEAAIAAAHADGMAKANARMNAVFASAEYVGREASAQHKLTAAEYAGFSAEQIIASLGKETKVEASTLLTKEEIEAKAEEAARKEMKGTIDQNKNSTVVPGAEGASGDGKMSAQAIDAIWDKAVSRVSPAPTK